MYPGSGDQPWEFTSLRWLGLLIIRLENKVHERDLKQEAPFERCRLRGLADLLISVCNTA